MSDFWKGETRLHVNIYVERVKVPSHLMRILNLFLLSLSFALEKSCQSENFSPFGYQRDDSLGRIYISFLGCNVLCNLKVLIFLKSHRLHFSSPELEGYCP